VKCGPKRGLSDISTTASGIGKRVRLYSPPGNDLTWRFPLIVESVAKLRSRSCIIDGEAVACGEDELLAADRPTAFTVEGANTQHVAYRGTDNHIYEVFW
jgi:hypothetical protein